MVVHRGDERRMARIAVLAAGSMVLAAALTGAQGAERNTDARVDSNSRQTGTTYTRTEQKQQKKKTQAVVPKKKGPMDPN